jgi:iron-sulfur cluster assembly accessory protein
MITVTAKAAEKIRHSAKEGSMMGMPLRIACMRNPDGSFHYALGFDDQERPGDAKFTSEGIEIVVADSSMALLRGTVVDYVQLESGEQEIVFLNPNDPNYQAADDGDKD